MNKLIVTVVISAFAILPVRAGSNITANGTILQGQLISTAACSYGYAKNKKTGNCVELKCKASMTLDKNGHKCIAKPKPASTRTSTPRGSY